MPYKDKEKQKIAQLESRKRKRIAVLAGKVCTTCGAPATSIVGAKGKGKSFSWSLSAVKIEEKLKTAVLCCELHVVDFLAIQSRKNATHHGHSKSKDGGKSRTYTTWTAMRERCGNPNHERYDWYGGRGIKVCERWQNSFVDFLADMGERPEGMTLDRIDGSKGYEPGNCKWATWSEQCANRTWGRRKKT